MHRLFVLILLTVSCLDVSQVEDRPNIVWITSEDNSPYLGCYGDELAQTPLLRRIGCYWGSLPQRFR